MSEATNRWAWGLAAGILLLLVAMATMAAGAQESGLSIAQPEYLSVQVDNTISFEVYSSLDQRLPASFTLVSEDGLVSVPLDRTLLHLAPGPNACTVIIGANKLAPFAIGETVTLQGQVGPWLDDVDATLIASPVSPKSSGWLLNAPATAMLYTTQDSQIAYRIINPKSKPLHAKLVLKFRNRKGAKVASWKYPTLAAAGQTNTTVVVPVAISVAAKAKNAVSVRTVLVSAGLAKSKAVSLVDWDLVATATADRISGPTPLTITFIGSASGGTPLYQYQWDFGDGTPVSALQTPTHTYTHSGIYQVVLSVADSLGGSATGAPVLITVQ